MRTHEYEYVLGFVFGPGLVYLIEKKRPEWQRGKLNGIGGALDGDEEPVKAMRREFREETGIDIDTPRWRRFARLDTLRPGVARVWLYTATLRREDREPMTKTDETVLALPVDRVLEDLALGASRIHDNLSWMIPMALAESPVVAEVQEVESIEFSAGTIKFEG